MAIILATTTITVSGVRPQSSIDPDAYGYDGDPAVPVPGVIAEDVRACISAPVSARDVDQNAEVTEYALRCDLFEGGLTRYDTVTDDKTGVSYEVRVVALSVAEMFGMQHIKATLRKAEGVSNVATTA